MQGQLLDVAFIPFIPPQRKMQPSKTVSLINWMTSDSFNKKIGKVILLMRGLTFSQHWLRVWVIEQKHSHQLSFSKNTFFKNQLLSASSKRIIVSHTDPPILYTFYFLFVHVLLSHHFFLLWSFQSQKKAVSASVTMTHPNHRRLPH